MDEKHQSDLRDISQMEVKNSEGLPRELVEQVLRECDGNREEAEAVLQGIQKNNESEEQRKINELKEMFQNSAEIDEKVVVQCLKEADWDVDAAIPPMFAYVAKVKDEERKTALAAQNEARRVEAEARKKVEREQASQFLAGLFSRTSLSKINQILENNKFDVDAATDELLALTCVDSDKNDSDQKAESKDAPPAQEQPQQPPQPPHQQQQQQPAQPVGELKTPSPQCSPALAPRMEPKSEKEKCGDLERQISEGDEFELLDPLSEHENIVCALQLSNGRRTNLPSGVSALFALGHGTIDMIWVVTAPTAAGAAPVTDGDWIELHQASSNNGFPSRKQRSWHWVGQGELNSSTVGDGISVHRIAGKVSFAVPAHPGYYRFVYCSKRVSTMGCGEVKQSLVVYVGPQYVLRATFAPWVENKSETKKSMLTASVKFSQLSGGQFGGGWIGCYETEDGKEIDAGNYVCYKWMEEAKRTRACVVDGQEVEQWELEFNVPKAGEFEFRLYPLKFSYDHVAKCSMLVEGTDSLVIAVDGTTTLVHSSVFSANPARQSVWVGLYKKEEENMRQWRRYAYISSAGTSTHSFKTPIHKGTYEARLLVNSEVVCTSVSVPIDGAV